MNKRLRNALKGLTATDAERRRRAMEPFVRATFGMFIKYLYRYLGNEVECEDVLEDVYADIWEKPERLCNITSEKQLLKTVYLYYMRNRLREVYRRINRNLYLSQNSLKDLIAPEIGTLEMVSRSELQDILFEAMAKLPTEQREVVSLHIHGKMKFREIAEQLALSINTVQSRYRYGIEKLRTFL